MPCRLIDRYVHDLNVDDMPNRTIQRLMFDISSLNEIIKGKLKLCLFLFQRFHVFIRLPMTGRLNNCCFRYFASRCGCCWCCHCCCARCCDLNIFIGIYLHYAIVLCQQSWIDSKTDSRSYGRLQGTSLAISLSVYTMRELSKTRRALRHFYNSN